ncbi:MAG TPA: hypothetical protein VGO43_01750 [Pyrinomonadaceae bacterium]|nr:hypothetical protein [Pyrinomonadaceae bacterium]
MPSLEPQQCSEARLAAKQFYSFHFGNDMTPSAENLKARERFLTSELYGSLANPNGKTDYFTKADEYPKTFKMGTCESAGPDRATLQVQVYWQEERGSRKETTQREVLVDVVKKNDRWLINNVAEARTK